MPASSFAGLSLHLKQVVTHPEAKSLARITLSDYFVLLLVSLFLLALASDPRQLGLELLVTALVALFLMISPAAIALRSRRLHPLTVRLLVSRFGLSLLAYLGLGAIGLLFYHGSASSALQGLVVVVVVLLVVAVRNTWDLLVTIADTSPATH